MADENKPTCQADALLGLPPLKMVLAEPKPMIKKAATKPTIQTKIRQPRSVQEIVVKLIEHLTESV